MKTLLLLLAFLVNGLMLSSQPNCNVFLWAGDTMQYEACKLSEKVNQYYQFEMKAISILDSCIAICPYYAFAHYETAVVHLKAGDFLAWDKFINQAVKYAPIEYLGLRASCRGKFFADYEGAIQDIDSLDAILEYDIGYVHDAAYHLNCYKALCYKSLGEFGRSIEIFETQMKKDSQSIGLFDYLHLGVAYQRLNQHEKAIFNFQKQMELNDLAEPWYYSAVSFLELNKFEEFEIYIQIAEDMLASNQKMKDGYHVMEDEIFASDLEKLKKRYATKRN